MEYVNTAFDLVKIVNYISLGLAIVFAIVTMVLKKQEKDETFIYDLSRFIYKKSLITLVISGAIRAILYGADTGNSAVILAGLLIIAAYVIKEQYF